MFLKEEQVKKPKIEKVDRDKLPELYNDICDLLRKIQIIIPGRGSKSFGESYSTKDFKDYNRLMGYLKHCQGLLKFLKKNTQSYSTEDQKIIDELNANLIDVISKFEQYKGSFIDYVVSNQVDSEMTISLLNDAEKRINSRRDKVPALLCVCYDTFSSILNNEHKIIAQEAAQLLQEKEAPSSSPGHK